MITIPTRDLVGIIADALPFALNSDDFPELSAIRVEWDGGRLHAMATDGFMLGWSTWCPDDPPERDTQDDLFSEPGGGDDPWHIHIPLPDAKDLVAAFKLPAKEGGCPLTVDKFDGLLTVKRGRETGYSALTMAIAGAVVENPPDIRSILGRNEVVKPTGEVVFDAKRLAAFAKVRPRGPMRLTFGEKLALVAIGERFVGALAPVREEG